MAGNLNSGLSYLIIVRKERLLTFPFAIWDGMTIFEVPAYLRIGVSSGCTCQLQMVTLFYDYRHALQE